jgi:hypothetical protein
MKTFVVGGASDKLNPVATLIQASNLFTKKPELSHDTVSLSEVVVLPRGGDVSVSVVAVTEEEEEET